jgi:hypothetical protein
MHVIDEYSSDRTKKGKRESGLTITQRGFPTSTSLVPTGVMIFAKILQTRAT